MTRKLRRACRAWLIFILAGGLPAWAHAQTDPTVEAPAQESPSKDRLGFFGELVSISSDQLVLRQTTYRFAPDAKAGGEPEPTITDRVIQIPEGTQVSRVTTGDLQPGAMIFVGARQVDGVLVAVVISDLAQVNGADPATMKEQLRIPIENALASAVVRETAAPAAPGDPNCLAVNGFQPTSNMVDFKGCYGGPNLSVSAGFTPTKIANQTFLGREVFSLWVKRFELNLGLQGWSYEFPFKFSAVDPSQVAIESWARTCLAQYGSVEAGVCPLTRPWQPAPTQARNIEVTVTPVDPWPAGAMQGGLGGTIGFEFMVAWGEDCGPGGNQLCDPQSFFVDFGPFAQNSRARGAPPMPGNVLAGEATTCLTVGGSLVLQFVGVPIFINSLLSPFDVLVCYPFELHNVTVPGFTAKVTPTSGVLVDTSFNKSPNVTFRGYKEILRYSPSSGVLDPSIRFDQFRYHLDWVTQAQIKLKSSVAVWYQSQKWSTGAYFGLPFVWTGGGQDEGTTVINPETNDWLIPRGQCLVDADKDGRPDTYILLNTSGFVARQPACIDVPLPLAAAFGSATIYEHYPRAVSPDGGTIVRVRGTGFLPGKKTDGSPNGTGVTRVDVAGGTLTACPPVNPSSCYAILSDEEILVIMPAHPSTILTDDTGAITSLQAVSMLFYAWGDVIYRTVYYAARPTIRSVGTLDSTGPYHFADVEETVELPVGSVRGGERVLISGFHLGTVTDVYFSGVSAGFADCAQSSAHPLCAGVAGGIVARVPYGQGAVSNCVTLNGNPARCDYVKVRSACVGDDLANGHLTPGTFCGMGLEDPDIKYVRKPPPQVNITPAGGPPGTPVQITINGSGFLGTPTVKIGAATIANICNVPGFCAGASDTQLVVTVPASAVGTSQIRVINRCPAFYTSNCGESDPVSFRHLDVPKVTSLSPSQGTYSGGTLVTLTGQGLTTATTLTFGGTALPFTLDATTPDTKLTFTTPPGYPNLVSGLPAAVNVVITVACGTAATTSANACGSTAPVSYTYLPPAVRLAATLQVGQITGEVGRPAPVSATLTDFSTGVPLPNRTISFSVLGVSIGSAVTNASGVAALTATMPNLLTGAYAEQTVATFAGDAVYFGITSVNWLILTHPEVVAWGSPFYPADTAVPALLQGVAAVAAGGHFTLALKHDGTITGWGDPVYEFAPPAGLSGVIAISAGYSHSLP